MPTTRPLSAASTKRSNLLLAVTVLFSAWLLFQIQPLAVKRILPWFGGGPAVWTTAMLFFQTLLLAGYVYAHLSNRLLPPRTQAFLHAALLFLAAVLLGVFGSVVSDDWKPPNSDNPQLRILTILAVSVGLPYMMLAATAPLVQSWLGRTSEGRSPYRLYALSNVGSLAALVSYPLVVEPLLGIRSQGVIWSGMFAAFAILCAASGWSASETERHPGEELPPPPKPQPARGRKAKSASETPPTRHATPTILDRFFWLALPACASVLLLAITNYLCQDVAPMPLLWIAPLVIYLLTFILTFESDRWYWRWPWLAALVLLTFGVCNSWTQQGTESLAWPAFVNLALLLAVGMVCHGEVVRMRPSAKYLTSFYLHLAAGGGIGGVLVAIVAPRLFTDYYELPLGMLAAWVLAIGVLATDREWTLFPAGKYAVFAFLILLGIVLVLKAQAPVVGANFSVLAAERNFFGVLKVEEIELGKTGIKCRRLLHGKISHGAQFLSDSRRREPTQYFSPASGVGKLLQSPASDSPRRVGIVGLGAGTLAAYANADDNFTYYEVDPQVNALADRYFTYLADARQRGAKLRIVTDDARLALEREPPQQFDVLVLDAFNGDAIPVHLLTSEAFALYLSHLRPQSGVMAVHITNRNLDLAPVIKAVADRYRLDAMIVESPRYEPAVIEAAVWVLLYQRDPNSSQNRIGQPLTLSSGLRPILWTDDYSSLLGVLRP